MKRKTAAPFAVNASGRVIRLNADRVDGLDSLDLAPVAVGVIDSSGDLLHGRGVASVDVDPTSQQYVIDLDGAGYRSDRFTTVVTTTCAGVVARTTSSSGSLVVALQDSDLAARAVPVRIRDLRPLTRRRDVRDSGGHPALHGRPVACRLRSRELPRPRIEV